MRKTMSRECGGFLQQADPDDYVLATGEAHSVREFITLAFEEVGVTIEWSGDGLEEVGICSTTGRTLVQIDSRYFRPTEVDLLLGDPSKARQRLGWTHKKSFRELVREMVSHDLGAIGQTNAVNEIQRLINAE